MRMRVLFIVVITDGWWCGGGQDVLPSVCPFHCCVSQYTCRFSVSLSLCVCDMFVVHSPHVHVVVCAFLSA